VFSETQLWQHLGFVDGEHDARRLYTPAMLAELLGTSVAVVRRWHRKGLIVPVREVHRLPYFDFQEVATARHLAELLAAGCSPQTIERKLAALARVLPKIDRPLAQLSIIVEGKQILLRQGDGLIEPGGQLRFDFESTEDDVTAPTSDPPAPESISFSDVRSASLDTPEAMAAAAAELEDEGRLDAAADMYRALLASTGPLAEVNFNLAELLYRQGELAAARERYYMAVELDEDYVEARANLGCVLAELGETELAIAAFEGALRHHGDYPDAHYHLARTLDEQGQREQAESHWRTFLTLAADSPWAEEARVRLALGE
jgi:tetratricopeptide (TPR) repeat protein